MSAQRALAIALARAGDPTAVPALRELVGHAREDIRMLAQVGLARARDDDPGTVEPRLAAEGSLGVYTVLAARAGRLAIGPDALAYLAAQAAYARTPALLRAHCVHAIARHDRARGAELAATLDSDARAQLEALERGEIDRVGTLLGW